MLALSLSFILMSVFLMQLAERGDFIILCQHCVYVNTVTDQEPVNQLKMLPDFKCTADLPVLANIDRLMDRTMQYYQNTFVYFYWSVLYEDYVKGSPHPCDCSKLRAFIHS